MNTFTTSTDTATFHCLQDERMRQALHQRLVRQALHNRRDRIANSRVRPEHRRIPGGRPLKGTARS